MANLLVAGFALAAGTLPNETFIGHVSSAFCYGMALINFGLFLRITR